MPLPLYWRTTSPPPATPQKSKKSSHRRSGPCGRAFCVSGRRLRRQPPLHRSGGMPTSCAVRIRGCSHHRRCGRDGSGHASEKRPQGTAAGNSADRRRWNSRCGNRHRRFAGTGSNGCRRRNRLKRPSRARPIATALELRSTEPQLLEPRSLRRSVAAATGVAGTAGMPARHAAAATAAMGTAVAATAATTAKRGQPAECRCMVGGGSGCAWLVAVHGTVGTLER